MYGGNDMKKKILSLSLSLLLGIALPVSAAPCSHQGYHNHRPVPVHHAHCINNGYHRHGVRVSFSTGVLARRSYWDPCFYYDYPINYPMYNNYCAYPLRVSPVVYMDFRI